MYIGPTGPDRFGPQENFLTPPPQLGASLQRLQDPQVQQSLLPLLQMQQKNAAMLLQMMQILSTLMGNQEATVQATSAEANLGNFDQQSSVLDGSNRPLSTSPLGEQLARFAEQNARELNTPGQALREVTKVLRHFHFQLGQHRSCYQLVGDLRQSRLVQEVQLDRAQLQALPPGAIVVWDRTPHLVEGHISIALGQGREASSTLSEQQNLNANLWVFLPQ